MAHSPIITANAKQRSLPNNPIQPINSTKYINMKDKKTNKIKPSKCAIHKCSLIKRSKLSQTGLSDLVTNQPHPTMDGLYFVGLSPNGRERWQTADEIADRTIYQSKYYKSNQSEQSAKLAAKRAEQRKQNDRQANDLITKYGKSGMAKCVWVKLDRPIKARLQRMMPNIVWVDEADRAARHDSQMTDLNNMMEMARLDAERAMKEKMEHSRSIHSTISVAESVTIEEIETEHERQKRKPLAQDELNALSNSRYEMPKCYSDFAQLTEDESEGDAY